ncbi:carboxypeptidase O-like [Neolamprologus brichardi]|uniref:carboxypeptidase O-like n=1 Tax=Neolamprologus brichardi TaxID=32507 RepID=UPI0003EBDE56|nr:carboxypeptidase O-like [Neolamprologus brichardi]
MKNQTRLWRKNRSPGPEDCSCYGTDLNRNFDVNWGTVGVSFNCCSKFYPGSKAMSELEIRAVTDFVRSRKDSFLCFLSIHSYGQKLLIPYGHPKYTAPNYDELMMVGQGATEVMWMVHRTNYTVGTPPDILYPMSGSTTDWARMQGITLSYTFELRDNGTYRFELPEDQIQPTCEEAYRGVLYVITYAHDKTFNGAVANTAVTLSGILLTAGVTGATLR